MHRAQMLFSRVNVTIVIAASLLLVGSPARAQNQTASDWKAVEQAMGWSGQVQPGGVIRFSMPRKDLRVMVGGVAVKPGLALGSWAAFQRTQNDFMVMGDLVLAEDEVQPIMRKLQQGGIEIAALHNHLIGESPRVMYMHIASRGDAAKMAQVIHDALALTKTPGPDPSGTPRAAESLEIDQKKIEDILGHAGKVNGGILQVSVPRAETINEDAMVVPPPMGVATALNFQPTGGGKAAITGDFVLTGREVNPVMRALRENGIAVTAVHSHMLMEEPRLFFMHFWANDDALMLARGLRTALDLTNSQK